MLPPTGVNRQGCLRSYINFFLISKALLRQIFYGITFSPAKSWILGLQEYRKPLMHLHTQFNEEIPYDTIDMDFMNEQAFISV